MQSVVNKRFTFASFVVQKLLYKLNDTIYTYRHRTCLINKDIGWMHVF